jgi:pimeloyl-ACP methyl ester carboxylesterase
VTPETALLDLDGGRIEYEDIPGDDARPALVFMHEGLGSIRLWRGFPARVAEATGRRAVTFARYGHGRSSLPPRPRTPAFMHEEAREVVPQVLDRLGLTEPILVGHSDGASIALIHAAESPVSGVAVLGPHVFVEDETIAGIEAARDFFQNGGLRERMARHHDDPGAAFHGWCDVWLDPAFRDWNIEEFLPAITVPVLAVQGVDDAYGTLAQIDAIERGVGGPFERVVLPGGHSPHLDQPEETVRAVVDFVGRVPALSGAGSPSRRSRPAPSPPR